MTSMRYVLHLSLCVLSFLSTAHGGESPLPRAEEMRRHLPTRAAPKASIPPAPRLHPSSPVVQGVFNEALQEGFNSYKGEEEKLRHIYRIKREFLTKTSARQLTELQEKITRLEGRIAALKPWPALLHYGAVMSLTLIPALLYVGYKSYPVRQVIMSQVKQQHATSGVQNPSLHIEGGSSFPPKIIGNSQPLLNQLNTPSASNRLSGNFNLNTTAGGFTPPISHSDEVQSDLYEEDQEEAEDPLPNHEQTHSSWKPWATSYMTHDRQEIMWTLLRNMKLTFLKKWKPLFYFTAPLTGLGMLYVHQSRNLQATKRLHLEEKRKHLEAKRRQICAQFEKKSLLLEAFLEAQLAKLERLNRERAAYFEVYHASRPMNDPILQRIQATLEGMEQAMADILTPVSTATETAAS